MLKLAFNITDLFMGMAQGDGIAWLAFGGLAGCAVLGIALLFIWWKLPNAGKTMFINNMSQTSDPMVIMCMPHKLLKFEYPKMFNSGILHGKFGWYISAKKWLHLSDDISQTEIDAITNQHVYGIEGAPGRGVFVNYSLQTQLVSTELLAMLQHGKTLEKLKNGKIVPKIRVDEYIKSLQLYKASTKNEFIELKPINIELPLNIDALGTILNRSFSKPEAELLENQIESIVKKGGASGINWPLFAALLAGVSALVGIACLVKLFGLF